MNKKNIIAGIAILLFCCFYYGAGAGLIWVLTGLSFKNSLALFVGITFLVMCLIVAFDNITMD